MKAVLIFRRRRSLNRWRVAPEAGASAFSGVMVFFVWYYANFGIIHLTFSAISRLTFV